MDINGKIYNEEAFHMIQCDITTQDLDVSEKTYLLHKTNVNHYIREA
jgi:hypothetical protein